MSPIFRLLKTASAFGGGTWHGDLTHAELPRAHADTIEQLLGKRGTTLDRHSIAASDTTTQIRNIRTRVLAIRADWDEAAMIWQLVAHRTFGYAPLVDIWQFPDLHSEDTAFYHHILSIGNRNTAEKVSLTAQRSAGGLQLASMVECAVSSVATELLFLFNGNPIASGLARDSFREAMETDPEEAPRFTGLVALAIRFFWQDKALG